MSTLGQWQPIETAPKDGTHILIAFGGAAPSVGAYHRDDDDLYPWKFMDSQGSGAPIFNGARDGEYGPTHWMPLPCAPGSNKTAPMTANELALQSQLDAANEGAWEYERQLNAALKSLQEIADMHVGDQPAALAHYSEADWVRRHAVMTQHIAYTAVKAIVADEGAKPRPVDATADLIAALQSVTWMAEEWFKYNGCDATCADEYRRDLDRADAVLAKAGAQ